MVAGSCTKEGPPTEQLTIEWGTLRNRVTECKVWGKGEAELVARKLFVDQELFRNGVSAARIAAIGWHKGGRPGDKLADGKLHITIKYLNRQGNVVTSRHGYPTSPDFGASNTN